jgi:glutathione S-transferase
MKLTYFDVDGGRGEPIRLAMFLGNLEFHDHRFPFSDFAEVRKSTPLGQVPTIEINNETITQCNAITRYVGKLTNLYPHDNYQALLCDEVMDAVEDISYRLVTTFGLEGDDLKQAREQILEANIRPQMVWLEQKLTKSGSYFCDNRLTIADLKVFVYLNWIASGMLDHIPQNLIDDMPNLASFWQRIKTTPEIMDYYQSR